MSRQKPIGIFDSGLGGLSIGRAIKAVLPKEDLLYFADLAFSPYGSQSDNVIVERSQYIVNFLIAQGCKAIVVACNTATVHSIDTLRAKSSIPIIGIEPGIKPAALDSKNGVIGVLATEQTLNSDSFKQLKSRYSKTVRIETQACPKFVALVENTEHNSEIAREITEQYIRPLLSAGCDKIILGCTHFSFLTSTIKEVVGDDVEIIDTTIPVVKQLCRILSHHKLRRETNVHRRDAFWTSGNSEKVQKPMSRLWGSEVCVSELHS